MKNMRNPSAFFLCVGTVFFLLYLLPWHQIPSIQIPISPVHLFLPASPSSSSSSNISYENYNFSIRESPNVHSISSISRKQQYGRGIDDGNQEYYTQLQLFNSKEFNVPGLMPYIRINKTNTFNASLSSDVLVLLHIQKTGGTSFEKHLVQDLVIEEPCVCWKKRKRCRCQRPGKNSTKNYEPWLFSRFSTGWICGLHADWTELTNCVSKELDRVNGSPIKRRYFYISMIREPIHRFLSEFRHVQRGATWKASRHICNNLLATADELGNCYTGLNWSRVSLDEFLDCPHNMGFNRQTRMLANLSLVGCYDRNKMSESARNQILLASAKQNLESMAFVGITEFQRISQYVFEETFQARFKTFFTQNDDTYSKLEYDKLSPKDLERIRQVNLLDLEIYSFAKQLLHSRFKNLKKIDLDFNDHYNYLGEDRSEDRFTWDEVENNNISNR